MKKPVLVEKCHDRMCTQRVPIFSAFNHEDFWIKMGNKYVYIRYFAVRNDKGEYLGVLEVSQDIKPIQDITGEKRLVLNDT